MTKKICFNTNLIYFIVLVAFVVVRICSACGVFSFMGSYGSIIMGFVTQIGIILLLPFLLFKFLSRMKFKETFQFFGFKKISWKSVLAAIALGFVVFCINIYVSTFFNSAIQFFGYKPSGGGSGEGLPATWWVLLLNLITTAVLPAICEETLHRGMLLQGNTSQGIKKAILISGLLFGLLHLNIEQVFYASVIGLFLGWLCLGCNSIYPCIIIHFMNNATSVFLGFAADKGWAIGNVFSWIANFLQQNVVLGLVMMVLLLLLLLLLAWELTNFLIKDGFKYGFIRRQAVLAEKAIRENFFQQVQDIKNDVELNKSMLRMDDKTIRIDMNQFLDFVRKNMEVDKDEQKQKDKAEKEIKNVDLKIKILLWGSFALSGMVTIMTFIWGLLR